jgi:very-short-patch-repair endonuclease
MSEPEIILKCQLIENSIEAVSEHVFHPTRKWRFDFAIIDKKIAIEVEGGTWSGGRHTRGSGFKKDCEKYNNATLLGWQVYRFTSCMVFDNVAIDFIKKIIHENKS